MSEARIVVAIQARTNSSRLPGKVLLPISGMPISVLAAKRAGRNKNFDVCVLTSKESTDDYLASVLAQHSVDCFRGDLNNVLSRFVEAFQGYPENTIVVRLTADNVFPDAEFIEGVIDQFIATGVDYICANGEQSNLPYGLAVEVTRLVHLREALRAAASDFDCEHVTPYIRRKFGDSYYMNPRTKEDLTGFRCTIDSLDDYLQVVKVFENIVDPVAMPALELCMKLDSKARADSRVAKLVLGGAQLGLNYGVNNSIGQPTTDDAHSLLSQAVRSGVYYIDTARAYGVSEKVIGEWLKQGWSGRCKVITKLDPLSSLNKDANLDLVRLSVSNSIIRSCHALVTNTLDVLMLHRAEHMTLWNGTILDELLHQQALGTVQEIGVSVQNPMELEAALANTSISFIQLPFNILDERWHSSIDKILAEKSKRNLTIHVRSVFLQGLLLSGNPTSWLNAHVENYQEVIQWLTDTAVQYNCSSIYELCVRHACSQSWIDALVLGCESREQLDNNITAMSFDTPSPAFDVSLKVPFELDQKTLNPAMWS
jgi:spore coat polysaccharide biosynthesis protein SpsF (cytidylyltransferase family)/aryl-alcohol dehydrogenase-like predicted oxidoreductase